MVIIYGKNSEFKFKNTINTTNLAQPIPKQCLLLFSLWCKKQLALAIKEKVLKQNMVRSKCLNHFESQMLLVVHRMKNFWV